MTYRMLLWDPQKASDPSFVVDAATVRPEGLPTVFDGDQRPVLDVNKWLLSLSGTSSSADTWKTYAREIIRFATFLESDFGLALLDEEVLADGDELLRVYQTRCTRPDQQDASASPVGDAKSTVGKRRAAITHFYRWAKNTGRIQEVPFRMVTVQTKGGLVEVLAGLRGGRRTLNEREPIPSDQIDRFFRVGLLGQSKDGSPDPAFGSYVTARRNAAGFALGVGAGLRHSEVLAFTIFELPLPHADGFTSIAVADQTAKGDVGRRVIAFSEWLKPVHEYVQSDRRDISRRATWRPRQPVEVVVERTNRHTVTVLKAGREMKVKWRELDLTDRRHLVLPGGGSPLLLLNHRDLNGSPLTDPTVLNQALANAGERCASLWPEQHWDYSMHHLRHTFGTELTHFLAKGKDHIADFRAEHGRTPIWADMVRRESVTILVQDSMGHASPETTKIYQHSALWNLLMSVNADPALNPALSDDVLT